jgi:translation initiation factor 2 beta subunit (eIF-2beta)/eIF-5
MSRESPKIPVKKGEDPQTYRYLMPRVVTKTNATWTVISNTANICHDIGLMPPCLRHWLANALAVAAKMEKSEILLQGNHHDGREIQNQIYQFIDAFILCSGCSNPETYLLAEGGRLYRQCRACGQKRAVHFPKSKNLQKMEEWILSHIDSERLQEQVVKSDGAPDTLENFQVARDLF